MHIEILLEEQSAEEALKILLPKILPADQDPYYHVFSGKNDLLRKLPGLLKGYRHWLPEDSKIVVLVDRDGDNCKALKNILEKHAADAGFLSKTVAGTRKFQVLNRIAIEELEAWFLGDAAAICAAYPGVPSTFWTKSKYANPDAISGGTWEALEKLLQASHYYVGGLQKIKAAKEIATQMNISANRSRSFNCFLEGLNSLV